mgnify:FL=1
MMTMLVMLMLIYLSTYRVAVELEESTTQQGYSVEVPERLTQVIADTALIGVTW